MRNVLAAIGLAGALSACVGPEMRVPVVDPDQAAAEAETQITVAAVGAWHRRFNAVFHEMPFDRGAREEALVRERIGEAGRLHRVAQRVLAANAALCGEGTRFGLGLRFADPALVPAPFRQAFTRVVGGGSQPRLLLVSEAAEAAGLHPGDEVVAIDGHPPGSPAQEALAALLARHGAATPIEIAVRRDGAVITTRLAPLRQCAVAVDLTESDKVNAAADRGRIAFTAGMLRFLSEEELAVVFGHELAHLVLRHLDKMDHNAARAAGVGQVVSFIVGKDVTPDFSAVGSRVYSRGFEAEADYVGVYLTARAGYDVARAAELWRRMATLNPVGITEAGSHPASADRFVAVTAAAAEVAAKQRDGRPLLPESR